MDTVLKWITAIGGALHWFTGWLIHPEKGCCCHTDEVKDKIDDLKNNKN